MVLEIAVNRFNSLIFDLLKSKPSMTGIAKVHKYDIITYVYHDPLCFDFGGYELQSMKYE